MIKRLALVLSTVMMLGVVLMPAMTLAYDPFQAVCNMKTDGQGSSLCTEHSQTNSSQNPLTGPNGLLRGIATIVAFVAGLAAVVIIIIGGLKFVTSGGDAAKAKSAKDTIVSALIGLVIIALAGTIISFVLGRL